MTEHVRPPVEPRTPRPAAAHPSHDQLLIARLAADDVDDTERAIAHRLVAECTGCADLLADITAIAASTRHDLPVPRRPRDFTITAEQAERLRRRPGFMTWFRRALMPGGSVVQPLAGAALSIGLALVVAGTILPSPTHSGLEVQAPLPAAQPTMTTAAGSDTAAQGPGAAASPEATRAAGDASLGNVQPPELTPMAAATSAPTAAGTAPAAETGAPATNVPVSTPAATEAAGSPAAGESTQNSYSSASAAPSGDTGAPSSSEDSPGAKSPLERDASPSPGGSDDLTTGVARIVPGPTPAPTEGRLSAFGRAQDDLRPAIIVAGFLLLLIGAALMAMRRATRRA